MDAYKIFIELVKQIGLDPEIIQNVDISQKRINSIIKFYENTQTMPYTIEWDILMFMIYLSIKDKLSKKYLTTFIEHWKKNTRSLKSIPNFIYDPPKDYLQLSRTPNIIEQVLTAYEVNRDKENFEEEYLLSLRNIIKSQRMRFSDSEFLIMKTALKLNTLNARKIANEINGNISYITRIIKKLVNENILFERYRISFGALGLIRILAIIEYSDIQSITTLKSPWVYSQMNSKYGAPISVVHFLIPESWKVPDICKEIKRNINKNKNVRNVQIFKVIPENYGMFRNFQLFDHKKGIWESSKSKIALEIEKRWSSGNSVKGKIVRITRRYFTDDELKVMKAFFDYGTIPLKKIREIVKIDYNKLRHIFKKLTSENIMVKSVLASGRLIPGNVTLMSKVSKEEHERLVYALKIMPELYSYRYVNGINNVEEISMIHLRVSDEQVDAVVDAYSKIVGKKIYKILSYYTVSESQWTLPIDRWINVLQEFKIKESDFYF